MPTYGDKKVKDMIRGVLPSTKRKWARDMKAAENQAGRVRARSAMADLEKDLEGDFDFQDDRTRRKIRGVTKERRSGDKVAPLQRWAPKVTEGAPDARLAQLSKMLPKDTIGRHAVTHVEFMKEFKQNPLHGNSTRWNRPQKETEELRRKRFIRENRHELLRQVLATEGLHKALNRYLKLTHRNNYDLNGDPVGPTRPRVLKGLGDIADFLKELSQYHPWPNRGLNHPEWLEAVDRFLHLCVEFHFDAGDVRSEMSKYPYNLGTLHTTRDT